MSYDDTEAANQKYNKNGWSEVEKLVLYRLDACETSICAVKDSMEELEKQRKADVEAARKKRDEQFQQLHAGIREIKDTYAAAELRRVESGKLKIEKDTLLISEQRNLKDRISRLEKIIFTVLGTAGIYILSQVLEHVL